ncbi:gamma-glutamyltransferase [Janibacter sp. G1551]|uniref:gamma-glutamyltransferase n=1 Tax=Janibacter sp. G1551 TaxID=3420440 RepID=UPI003CFDB75D
MAAKRGTWTLAAVCASSLALVAGTSASASPSATTAAGAPTAKGTKHPPGQDLPKVPVMYGGGGAVASVDRDASQVGIDVLRKGGNATDAAIAVAAAVGVTDPYASGLGGGGFFVHRDGKTGTVETIDGRETAPATFTEDVFLDEDGTPMDFETVVNSGLSVGVPGTPATWDLALKRYGTTSLNQALRPAEQLATKGFTVDQYFHDATLSNAERFSMFPETVDTFMPGGEAPAVGSTFTNPNLGKALRAVRTKGVDALYEGALGRAIVAEAQDPTTAPGVEVMSGQITMEDLADYEALVREPTHTDYRGLDVYGMPVPSSGGIAVGEILNLLESYEKRTGKKVADLSTADYLHWFSEASATAFADRNRYIGDVEGVPTEELLSQDFADERACLFTEDAALPRPVPFGTPDGDYAGCADAAAGTTKVPGGETHTTSLTVADKWGNQVAYTLTIEQYGGSGITVPGYGFLLNNELTDFNFAPVTSGVPDPNLPAAGKRPRSSMSPTLVVRDGEPYLSAGSPGGATIITTVAQILTGYIDRDLELVDAVAAPRLSSRNGRENAEAAIFSGPDGDHLRSLGHVLSLQEVIGNGSAIRVHADESPLTFTSAAETTRAQGGSAMVVDPQ